MPWPAMPISIIFVRSLEARVSEVAGTLTEGVGETDAAVVGSTGAVVVGSTRAARVGLTGAVWVCLTGAAVVVVVVLTGAAAAPVDASASFLATAVGSPQVWPEL